jgi:hypothetical protein
MQAVSYGRSPQQCLSTANSTASLLTWGISGCKAPGSRPATLTHGSARPLRGQHVLPPQLTSKQKCAVDGMDRDSTLSSSARMQSRKVGMAMGAPGDASALRRWVAEHVWSLLLRCCSCDVNCVYLKARGGKECGAGVSTGRGALSVPYDVRTPAPPSAVPWGISLHNTHTHTDTRRHARTWPSQRARALGSPSACTVSRPACTHMRA